MLSWFKNKSKNKETASESNDPELSLLMEKAEQGEAESQYQLGLLYLDGKGIKKNDSSKEERDVFVSQLTEEFSNACSVVCPNAEVLANILVDICYTSNKNKSFAWDIAGEQIFNNVLKKNGNIIRYPIKDDSGDIEFCGNKFSLHTQQIGGGLDVDFE